MSKTNYIGADNGTSGNWGCILYDGCYDYFSVPIKKELNYTKSKQFLNRIDVPKLIELLRPLAPSNIRCFTLIERPMINPMRWRASVSAIRALEATIIVFEILKISYAYIDSKTWQKELLPSGLEGKELKIASKEIAKRLFPNFNFDNFDDGDGILLAEYARRKGL